jgi:endonuclease YncB( thermonuclease family)
MADFQLLLYDDSFGYRFAGLDPVTPEIGRFLGFDPALGTTELTAVPSSEGIRVALVYQVPVATSDIELVSQPTGLNIALSLAAGGDVTNLGGAPVAPDLLEAFVTEVIDGRTIVVEADGFSSTIQYLGVTVPTGTQCYATQATTTNTNIVLGETVYLERQYRNRVSSASETLARDVWISNGQGGLVLVSAWLASEGAAVPSPADQDVRFAGWIQAAADAAEGNGAGFWAVCGGPPVSADGADTLFSSEPVRREDRFII